MKNHVGEKVDWRSLKGDKGFRVGLTLHRGALANVKARVDEISVPRTDLQWRQRLNTEAYRLLRARQIEKAYSGTYCTFKVLAASHIHVLFLAKNRPLHETDTSVLLGFLQAGNESSGTFRCAGCGNFLFESQGLISGAHAYATFQFAMDGGLLQSVHPRARLYDLDCSVCLSFIGRSTSKGIAVNSGGIYFDAMTKSEVKIAQRMCRRRSIALRL